MEMILKPNYNPMHGIFISSLLIFPSLCLQLKGDTSTEPSNPHFTEINQELTLSTRKNESNINITFLGSENEYTISKKYDFFVPHVDVVCQCSCTDEKEETCTRDRECAFLHNANTTCTIHITINSELSFCDKFYKLCCQVYFTKTKMMKPFKAFELKYHQSLMKFKIASKAHDGTLNEFTITVTENVKNLILSPSKVLRIMEFAPVRLIPDNRYFIEDGSNELQYSNDLNKIDEINMGKLGWFQYNGKELSKVKSHDLQKQLQVKLIDCNSNPPKYEWNLNAVSYISKGLFHLPKNIEKVSEKYKGISRILVNLTEDKIIVGMINPPAVNIVLSNAALYPFLFTSTIKESVLNVTFIKGNGTFYVEITSPHWTDILSFSTDVRKKIVKLIDKNYDSCWVCVSQMAQQICQIPRLNKYGVKTIETFHDRFNNKTQTDMINKNVTDFPMNTTSSITKTLSNKVVAIVITTISPFILMSLSLILILRRRRQRELKTRDVCEALEMEPLASSGTAQHPRSNFTHHHCRERSSKIQERIKGSQRRRYQRTELPQVNWTNKILPLGELYVDMELLMNSEDYDENKGELMQLEKLFHKIGGKDPVRILIEGGPGYGKTSLCSKLLSDWGEEKDYMSSKFKIVFLFELRYFKENDSIEEMLKRECETIGVKGDDGLECIHAFENETLLILDGFDEMNEECKRKFLPLLHKDIYPSMYVMVTSRKGMFQVEKRKQPQHGGFLEKNNENVDTFGIWNKRVLIKGVTTDKVAIFLKKYLRKDNQELEQEINSIIGGVMKEVFKCPLFLILLAMMLEESTLEYVNSKTTLYKEFVNFVIRRNLVREKKISTEEEVDIFSPTSQLIIVESLNKFGRLAIDHLCENDVKFEEKEILVCSNENLFSELGFLMKIPQMQKREKEYYYQPVHKSFLEFLAAFAMWNLFKSDENEFKQEIERIGNRGLKPTNDSLFYIFLGGLMNDKAYVLFQCLTRYSLWFNIESLCFVNILLEIKDIYSFFPAFQPILDPFIPSLHRINTNKMITREYFESEIHSLILKHSSDRQLIKILDWNSHFTVKLSEELNVQYIKLDLSKEIFKICSNDNRSLIKCNNIICNFSQYFQREKWNDVVSLLNSIQSEKIHFLFDSQSNKINSVMLNLLHKELMDGEWKQKNIDRLRFNLNKFDDPKSISLLVDLVKKERINEGIHLWIKESGKRTKKDIKLLKRETEKLFDEIIQSKIIKELVVIDDDCKISPMINFNRVINPQWKSFYFYGSLYLFPSCETRNIKHSVEELTVLSSDAATNMNLIQNIQGSRCLTCKFISFNSLVENEWSGLKETEELVLCNIYSESFHLLNSVSQLTHLQVLSLNVINIKTTPSKFPFINLFASLNLRICEFIDIHGLEIFSFFTEVLMDDLTKKKEKKENVSTIDSNEGNTFQLHELVIGFDQIQIDVNQLKQCPGIRSVKSMLRSKHLNQCCWINMHYVDVKLDQFESLFPITDKFGISCEVDGMNANNSHRSQFDYHWFSFFDRFCLRFLE